MWPLRMDMSWDECRQCLRCLELDAYGNMVSVLRAQGPFTEDKKKLLEELAKVLHITNERHRAEVRRAVNDEKLSLIAEQLNGPNTWTDWAIEGRRTIPLLPRLKSHTAFTGLANSLSLVIAAANEKKIPISEQAQQQPQQQQRESIVKAEASTNCKDVVVEERPLICSVSNRQGNTRGRKRKRSLPDVGDAGRNVKHNMNKEVDNDNGINSVNDEREKNTFPLLPINTTNETENDSSSEKSRCFDKSLMRNSITCTVTPIETTDWDDSINSVNSITCHDNEIAQSKITATNVNSNTDVQLELEKRLSCEIDELDAVDPQRNSERSKFELDSVTNDDSNTLTCENTPLSPSELDRMSSPALSQPPSPIVTVNSSEIMAINSDSTLSSGPGPPQINSSTFTRNKLPLEMLNHHNTTDTKITFNSNKIVNINDLPNARLDTKATNVIVIQKGPASGVTLSHGGKKVLGKVISNNGNRTIDMISALNSSHENDIEIENTNSKVDRMVILDIRQDISDETKSHSINNEDAIELFNSDTKTVFSNMDAHNLVEYSSEDCSSILAHHEDVTHTENAVIDDDNEDSGEMIMNEHLEIESAADVPEQSGCEEILISSETHVVIDGQTEIYNFESAEDNVCEIQIEASSAEDFGTEIVTTEINEDNYEYVVDDEETVSIPEDERGHYEQFHDLSDS